MATDVLTAHCNVVVLGIPDTVSFVRDTVQRYSNTYRIKSVGDNLHIEVDIIHQVLDRITINFVPIDYASTYAKNVRPDVNVILAALPDDTSRIVQMVNFIRAVRSVTSRAKVLISSSKVISDEELISIDDYDECLDISYDPLRAISYLIKLYIGLDCKSNPILALHCVTTINLHVQVINNCMPESCAAAILLIPCPNPSRYTIVLMDKHCDYLVNTNTGCVKIHIVDDADALMPYDMHVVICNRHDVYEVSSDTFKSVQSMIYVLTNRNCPIPCCTFECAKPLSLFHTVLRARTKCAYSSDIRSSGYMVADIISTYTNGINVICTNFKY